MQEKQEQLQEDPWQAEARTRYNSAPVAVIGDQAGVGSSFLALVDNYDDRSKDIPGPKEWWGARTTLAFLGFLGLAAVYAMRVNLSVAIVAMVKSEPAQNGSEPESGTCPVSGDWEEDGGNQNGEFDWSETTQGLVLGSFYIGYLITNIPGGRAAEYFGGKRVFGLGVLLMSVLTLISPLSAEWSTGLFIAVRILEGLAEGVTFPAMNSLLATWVPPMERARFTSVVYSGTQFGTVLTLPVSGWLCDTDFLGGWPSVFYVFGVLGLVWSLFWFILVFDQPNTHPRISQEEKSYIMRHCASKSSNAVRIPYKALATSLPVWCLILAHFGQDWGLYTLLTELPTYFKEIQHFDMTSNGLVSALPYFMMWVFSIVFSNVMERLAAAKKLSLQAVRKLSMVIGLYGPMVGLVAMCFVDCNKTAAVVVLCVAVGLNGAVYSGFMCSHQDLSPNLAGTLLGITNSVATIPGIVSPVLTGAITETQTLSAWRTVFLISAAIYLVTNIGYLLFMPVTVQPWNEATPSPEREEKRRY